MKRVKNYLECIYNASKDWDNGLDNAIRFLVDGDKQLLIGIMKHHTKRLIALDAQDVADAIQEHREEIGFRLKRIDNYRIWPTMQHIFDNADTTANFDDAEVNEALNICHDWIMRKSKEFIRVYQESEKYAIPPNPYIEKALKNEHLLRYFKGNRNELINYIMFCSKAKNPTEMAQEAVKLWERQVIDYENINNNLHEELKKTDLKVGTPNNWKTATYKEYKKHH